jgi:AcrR family transcriptional regulator
MQHIHRKGKEQKRNWILKNATETFFEKGFDAVSMDEIAQRADISKGSLYTYFKSKHDLYLAVYLQGIKLLNTEIGSVFSSTLSGIDMVRSIANHYMNFVENNSGYFEAMNFFENRSYFEMVKDPDLLTECSNTGQSSFGYLLRAIQVGQQDGSIRKDIDPRSVAIQIWAFTGGVSDMFFNKSHFEAQFRNKLIGEHLTVRSCVSEFMKTIEYAISTKYHQG